MNIVEALQKYKPGRSIRITIGDKWMLWNEDRDEWVVFQRKAYGKRTFVLISTSSESDAVAVLMEGE